MLQLEGGEWDGVFEALDVGVIVIDRAQRIVAWNHWFSAASNIDIQGALGRRLDEVFPDNDLRRVFFAITQALESGTSALLTHSLHPVLLPLRTRTGHKLIHNISIRAIGQRPYSGCVIQIFDITVAAHREKVLRERQNARYDAVVHSAPDVILTLDAQGSIQLANPAAARAFGYAADELIGQPIDVLLDDQEPWNELWAAALEGNNPDRAIEVVAKRKDGSRSYLEVSAARWHSDSRLFVTAILREINERRAAEEALRQLNLTLEQRVAERTADRDRMWRLSTDVMMVAQLDGKINAVNPAWTQLLGWEGRMLVGSNFLEYVLPDNRSEFHHVLRELSNSAAPRKLELQMATQDGGCRFIEWSAIAADGLVHAVGRDVTAERKAEQALEQAEEALRHAQKMEAIGQLTGGIAHDFNNMLTGIIGPLEIVKRRIAASRYEDTQRFMDAAITSANRAAALTHRLLAFARRQPLDPKAVDANQLIADMEDMLRRTLGEQVQMTLDLKSELWPTFTDGNQLENTLLNLAINARDAMPKGGHLTISTANATITTAEVSNQLAMDPGEYVTISVSDTGIGMTPEIVTRVFEPFFTTKPIGQGTGLGLSMIYGFAKQSRGHIQIRSAPGEGTTVSLYLPRFRGLLETIDVEDSPEVPAGAGETVLLVEDDSSVRLLIAEVLRELGYACIEVGDGQAALLMLRSNTRIDLLISDVGLPGLNGRQLAELARQQRPELKVLFVTGYAEHATSRDQFLAPGMEMVTKPFAVDVLALKIREMISS